MCPSFKAESEAWESEIVERLNRKQRQRHGLLGEPSAGQSGQRLDGTEVARYLFLLLFLI